MTAPLWFVKRGDDADLAAGYAIAARLCADPDPVCTTRSGSSWPTPAPATGPARGLPRRARRHDAATGVPVGHPQAPLIGALADPQRGRRGRGLLAEHLARQPLEGRVQQLGVLAPCPGRTELGSSSHRFSSAANTSHCSRASSVVRPPRRVAGEVPGSRGLVERGQEDAGRHPADRGGDRVQVGRARRVVRAAAHGPRTRPRLRRARCRTRVGSRAGCGGLRGASGVRRPSPARGRGRRPRPSRTRRPCRRLRPGRRPAAAPGAASG